jgi:phosphatidylserine/phosphatidylglycerophosphate/cardiolipin synthase-like enzyme
MRSPLSRSGARWAVLLALAGAMLALQAPARDEATQTGVRLYYSPGDDVGAVDARLIASARKRIDMAAYVLTDRALISALGAAAMRGVKVRIYLDGEESGRGAAAIEAIASAPNVELRRKGAARALMHLKSYAVDGRVLRSGSANFSVSGEERQDNDVILFESPALAQKFEANFERLWARSDNRRVGLQ